MFTKSKRKTIFLDPQCEKFSFSKEERVDVVLSPALYWVKKLTLPVKYLREVKKLLPSIFEDILLAGEYNYYVYKEGESYIAFAYEDRAILELLEQKGVNASQVGDIYFAQSELGAIQTPLSIDATRALMSNEGIVVIVPLAWVESFEPLQSQMVLGSKHKITLSQFGHIIDKKTLYRLIALLSVFIIVFWIEIFTVQRHSGLVEAKKEELVSKYDLKPTMMQNNALLKKYENIHAKQIKLRDILAKVSSLKLAPDQKLSLVALQEEKLVLEFEGKNLETIQKKLRSLQPDLSAKMQNDRLRLEGAL